MKKRINFKNKIELVLIVIICAFLLWLSITLILSELKKDMTKELKSIYHSMLEELDLNRKTMNNHIQIEKRSAKMAAYYLRQMEDPFSMKMLTRVRDIMELDAVYIIDRNGKILSSSAKAKNISVEPGGWNNCAV